MLHTRRIKPLITLGIFCMLSVLIPNSYGAVVPYSEDFEALDIDDTSALSDSGWLVFGAVFLADGETFLYGYGSFPAPNIGGPGFSSIAQGQGGPDQGNQQLSIYNDYNNGDHGNADRIIEASVFKESTITQADTGSTWSFSFDARRGNLELSSTANAFIKTLDPSSGFVTTNLVTVDMTTTDSVWDTYTISLFIDQSLVGQLLQFGFANRASNYEGSAMLYDNLNFAQVPVPSAWLLLLSGLAVLRKFGQHS